MKISLSLTRINNIENWLTDDIDLKTRLAIYKAGQEIVEVIIDVVAMIVKDEDKVPADDYTNLHIIVNLGIITETEFEKLSEANGLRNRLVYDTMD